MRGIVTLAAALALPDGSDEREALAGLRTRGKIGDDAFHQIEGELDWAEVHTLCEG